MRKGNQILRYFRRRKRMKKTYILSYLLIVLMDIPIMLLHYQAFKQYFIMYFAIILGLFFVLRYALEKPNLMLSYLTLIGLYLINYVYCSLILNDFLMFLIVSIVILAFNLILIKKCCSD